MASSTGTVTKPSVDELLSYHDLKINIVDKEVRQEIRDKIANHVIDWKFIGHCLGLSEGTLRAIEVDYGSEEERRIATLKAWHEQEDRATYLRLIVIFCNNEYRDLARTLCQMIKDYHDTSQAGRPYILSRVDQHSLLTSPLYYSGD